MKYPFIAHLRKSDRQPQYLWTHLSETSEFAGRFASKMGLLEAGNLIGLLHDIGKASEEFRQYIESAVGLINPDEDEYVDASEKRGKVDHSTAGAQILERFLSSKGAEGRIAAQVLSLCIASHHSGVIDCLLPDGQNNFEKRIDKSADKTHADEALNNLDENEKRQLARFLTAGTATKLTGALKSLKELNDSKETLMFKYGLLARFLFSCLIDADRLSTADFEFPDNRTIRNDNKYPSWDLLIERFGRRTFESKNEVDTLRSMISKTCYEFSTRPKGMYQLTVPTGGGKTFASLRFALRHAKKHGMDRIIYVIPYTSIIDQNAEEVRTMLEEKDDQGQIVLEHHSNLTPEEETRRQNLLSENWDAPVVFTTSVQFLEALFSAGTRGARRMHQLANAVIIFDEVQTIPIRCVHMFNVALRFLVKGCGSSVVLCTATQPLLDKIEKKERSLEIRPHQQMMPDVKSLFRNLKRVEVHDCRKPRGWAEEEVIALTNQELCQSGSVLIVVNTKSSATNLYEQATLSGQQGIFHLSTDMCPTHRMDVLSRIKGELKNKKPTICVSTQLIEAGVDIDFGSVIRYLAGLDSIAQAAGRCNRHGLRTTRGNVFIVNPANENLNLLEEIKIGAQQAERVLDEFKQTPATFDNDILSPSLMERYYMYYFYDRKDKMNYPVTRTSPIGRDDNLFDLLSTNPISTREYQRTHNNLEPQMILRQSFQKAAQAFRAIESLTRGVIVQYGDEGKSFINDLCATYEVEKQYKLLKKAQRYSVNVYPYVFENLLKHRAIHEVQEGSGIFYLDAEYYSNEFGLSREIVNEMETYIV